MSPWYNTFLYLDIHLNIDNWDGLKTKDWDIAIMNFPLIRSKISTAPAYGVYQGCCKQGKYNTKDSY
jgi:hypothetical protein